MNPPFDARFNYESPKPSWWSGRRSDLASTPQYWHEQVELHDLRNPIKNSEKRKVGLLGYACDEGVLRNQGREGAKEGPEALRQQLGKLAYHHSSKEFVDYGNITCHDGDLEAMQHQFAHAIEALLSKSIFPVAIGGGHDVAYGHLKGIQNYLAKQHNPVIGIVNFDAHFDLRPVLPIPNSGTPFYQILNEFPVQLNYLAMGIQKTANIKTLYNIAASKKVVYMPIEDCQDYLLEKAIAVLETFLHHNDFVYITIDMDGFSSAYAPGVSAPSPIGFSPNFVMRCLDVLVPSKKVVALDIAELNPIYDIDNATARLAARLVDYVVGQIS